MGRRRSRFAQVGAAVVLLSVLVPAGLASAEQTPLPGAPGQSLFISNGKGAATGASAAAAAAGLSCSGESAPAPQYSPSNRTLHWGEKLICNQAVWITLRDDLLEVVGSGDFQRYVLVDSVSNHGTEFALVATTQRNCNGMVTTNWIARAYATAAGFQVPPYPSWSSIHSLTCGA